MIGVGTKKNGKNSYVSDSVTVVYKKKAMV